MTSDFLWGGLKHDETVLMAETRRAYEDDTFELVGSNQPVLVLIEMLKCLS